MQTFWQKILHSFLPLEEKHEKNNHYLLIIIMIFRRSNNIKININPNKMSWKQGATASCFLFYHEKKQPYQQAVSCAFRAHHIALLPVGLCKSHSRRTQQALSKRTRHQYYAVVFNSGYNLFGLFPDCYSGGLVYQSSWLSPWCGHRVDAFRHRFSAVHSLRSTQHVLCFLRSFVHHWLWSRVFVDLGKSLCDRTWRQSNGNKSPQLLAIIQRLGLSVRNTCRGTVFLRWSFWR